MGWVLALVALTFAVVAIVAGTRGTVDEVFAAITGKAARGDVTVTGSSSAGVVDSARRAEQPNPAPLTRVGRFA